MKLRFKALLLDYLIIVIYLVCLFILFAGIYFFFLDGLPEFTENQMHLVSFLTTVFPVTIIFAIQEGGKDKASIGKRKMGLKLEYKYHKGLSSLARNIIKFIPWQFAHMSVIKGIYTGFEGVVVWVFYILSIALAILYIILAIYTKDQRHLPDLLTGSKVVIKEEKDD